MISVRLMHSPTLVSVTNPDGISIRVQHAGLQGPPGEPSPSRVFVQPDRPTQAGPWMWWRTSAGGTLLDLIINDGGP